MDRSLELIKEQHSSVSLVYAKYFLRQRCVWTIFQIFVFGQNSKHRVKTFEQTLWILHCNLSKDNTLQFREWIQSISLGSAACGFFGGKLFTCPFSKTECKPSSRRFGTLIGTPQSTTFLNFVDECKVIFNSIITLLTGVLFLCSQWNLILCTERHIVVAMKMHASLVRFYRAAIWLVRANNITSEISLNNVSLWVTKVQQFCNSGKNNITIWKHTHCNS